MKMSKDGYIKHLPDFKEIEMCSLFYKNIKSVLAIISAFQRHCKKLSSLSSISRVENQLLNVTNGISVIPSHGLSCKVLKCDMAKLTLKIQEHGNSAESQEPLTIFFLSDLKTCYDLCCLLFKLFFSGLLMFYFYCSVDFILQCKNCSRYRY
uniref:Uncharacterized protein n=1 Tax=Micrurus lemniscatus lemniscatus TaxID=129467 RepID=A0A2D4HXI1_MICLE